MLVMSQEGKQSALVERPQDFSTNGPEASSYLLSVPYRKKTVSSEGLRYTRVSKMDDTNLHGGPDIHETITPSVDLSDQKYMDQFVLHKFPTGLSWFPERIEINGRKGRRIICVVAKDNMRYRIHDLDTLHEAEESEENRNDETDLAMY